MRTHYLALGLALPVLAGCALFEALATGLGRINAQFDGQPEAYIARVSGNDTDGFRYLIDRITIAENREGRPDGVRFEGLREPHLAFPDIRFTGSFTDFSLRPDGARIAAIVEEDIRGDLETYLIITDTENDRLIRSTTLLGGEPTRIARACGPQGEFLAFLRQELEAFADPPVPPGTDYEVTLFAGGRFEDQLTFEGWDADGNPVFGALYMPYAEVRIDGELVVDIGGRSNWLQGTLTEFAIVRFSADDGRLLDCGVARAVPEPSTVYDLRPSAQNGLLVTPSDGGDYPLTDITGVPLRIPGRISGIAAPYE